jgi:diacylglycerol kinase family enzyme
MPKYNIILNVASGTAQSIGAENLKTMIENSGLEYEEIILCDGAEMDENLDKLILSPLPLLIGGGDGTIRYSAAKLLPHDKAFGIIPFGTMNMLARDLGIPTQLDETFNAYKQGCEEVVVDAAFVNEELYLCAASIGTMPSASQMREENREIPNIIMFPQLFLHTLSEFNRLQRKRIYLMVDGHNYKFRSPAIVISNNKFIETEGASFDNFKRGSLNDGMLAVYATKTQNIWGHLRFLGKLLIGKWLKDEGLKKWDGKQIIINTKSRREKISIDGDLIDLPTPIRFSIQKGALRLLRTKPTALPA